MAGVFVNLLGDDSKVQKTPLYEAVQITGSLFSGAYADPSAGGNTSNIKQYTHEMFESISDYPFLSASSNHLLDITFGLHTGSALSSSTDANFAKKSNVYNSFAQVLAGYDSTGSILKFDADGNYLAGGTKFDDAYFLTFSRLLNKDEMKRNTFSLTLGMGPTPGEGQLLLSDSGTSYKVNSPAGEYGILYATSVDAGVLITESVPVGLVFYQAGVAVLSASIFKDQTIGGILDGTYGDITGSDGWNEVDGASITGSLQGTIQAASTAFRSRVNNLTFSNTTELNSTIYFCRAAPGSFNYSSNPTYIGPTSQIRVKENINDPPFSYITTVGLYNSLNELMAVAKVSEPVKKTPYNDYGFRVRLDY